MTRSVSILLVALALAGCDETVDPVLESDRVYTLFGYLDPGSDRQAVRVFPIEPVLTVDGQDASDARVRSFDGGAEPHPWIDSLVTYDNGAVGTVFSARFRPSFGASYRFEAEHPDGRVASAAIRVPDQADVSEAAATIVRGGVRVPVTFDGVERLLEPFVVYEIESNAPPFTWTIPVSYAGDAAEEGNGWSLTVRLSRDIGTIYDVIGLRPNTNPLTIRRVSVRAFVTTDAWRPPGDVFDPELLVQPGTFSNVDGGFGFVGSGYTLERVLDPGTEALETAGFVVPSDG